MPSDSTLAGPDSAAVPAAPLTLGLAGLIPFWGLALAIAVAPVAGVTAERFAIDLGAYAALIASFLGGIRWGLATAAEGRASPVQFAIAVVPSLLAWCLLALPSATSLALLGVLVLALGPVDARLVRAGLAPNWFRRLRYLLSGGAGLALLFAAAAVAWR